jgi:hypothetical protein
VPQHKKKHNSVVVLILDNTLKVSLFLPHRFSQNANQSIPTPSHQPVLNAPEVDTLFSHPLASFLSTTFPERAEPRGPFLEAEAHAETAAVELQYHTYSDVPGPWSNHRPPTSSTEDSTGSAGGHVMRMHRFLTGREAGGIKPIYGLTACVFCLLPHHNTTQYCTPPLYIYTYALASVRSSSAPLLSRTVVHQTFPYRRVENRISTSVWLGRCVTPERESKRLCGGSASMLSAPHAFGISGKAASGGRVNSNGGCRLDCEFGKPTLLSLA